jgi:uncharacterized membrane protein YphA (DoxX/SURF4 family)
MLSDAAVKNSIVPFLLRLALAVIFIYHGWHKIADPGNDWGALWASNLADQSLAPPPDVLHRLDEWEQMNKEQPAGGAARADKEPLLPEQASERVKNAYRQLATSDYLRRHPETGTLQLQSSLQLLVAWGELVGGIALLLGLLTRLAAVGLIVIQVGAICTVTWEQGFSAARGAGYEYNVALIVMCLALVLLGGGTMAVDQVLRRRREAAAAKPQQPVTV